MAKLIEIKHAGVGACGKTAFYVRAMPVGRGVQYFDALTSFGMIAAMGKIVECENCHDKVDFNAINEYYEVEA